MINVLTKITSYKNWVGKLILWLLGLIMIISLNYAIILKGFLLTEKEIQLEYTSYITITSFGLLFIVGGMYLNKFLDKFVK